MTDLLLIVRGLTKRFLVGEREIEVLQGVDLEVMKGEKIAIIGESGVGKSTLLHVIGTLERPTDGQVLYDGINLFGLNEGELAKFRNEAIGFVFQFHYLLPDFTALENVMMPALIHGASWKQAEARAALLLEEVGLASRIGHRPARLSGGEQQRVAVARAMAQEPHLMLADEPTGNLDPRTAVSIQSLLTELCEARGATLITVTHNLRLAETMDRCFEIREGKLKRVYDKKA